MAHIPVLLNEVLKYLDPKPNQNFIDCTIGGGGHAFKILARTKPNGKLLGIDLWEEVIRDLRFKIEDQSTQEDLSARPSIKDILCSGLRLDERLILVCDNFANLTGIVKEYNFSPVHGILLDLGLSSDLLEKSGRGFSFQKDEPLDMRLNSEKQILTAEEILNQWPGDKLIEIFKKFGEERFSKLIARKVLESRKKGKIQSTFQLVNLIKSALGGKFHKKSLARIFQALRIAVNNELENLEKALIQAPQILAPGGKIVTISYHSLEDRIVKIFFKKEERLKIITKKPVRPTEEEIKANPRSRSAKLRIAVYE